MFGEFIARSELELGEIIGHINNNNIIVDLSQCQCKNIH